MSGKMMTEAEIQQALQTHSDSLMAKAGVVGIGQGLCGEKPCIKVFVIEKTEALEKQISTLLGTVPHSITETGVIKAQPPK